MILAASGLWLVQTTSHQLLPTIPFLPVCYHFVTDLLPP